jgi:hypothetical protein
MRKLTQAQLIAALDPKWTIGIADLALEYLALGWMALPSLEGTGHGIYSAHCVWLCGCRLAEPLSSLSQHHRQP